MSFHPFQIAFKPRALPEPRMEGCQSVEQRTNVVSRDLLRDVREPGVPRRQIFKHQSELSGFRDEIAAKRLGRFKPKFRSDAQVKGEFIDEKRAEERRGGKESERE